MNPPRASSHSHPILAHHKSVVAPCGFLSFIEETLAAGHTLRAVRTVTTQSK